jgi:hypothetical protein
LEKRLCRSQRWSGCSGVEKNLLPLSRIEPWPFILLPNAILTELSQLSCILWRICSSLALR